MTEQKPDPFHDIITSMVALHDKKAQDYGADTDPLANLRASTQFGVQPWIAAAIRMNDKVHRLQQFAIKGKLANESVEDSLMDIAVYAILVLILYREASEARVTPYTTPAQCPYVTKKGNGATNCVLRSGHNGPHGWTGGGGALDTWEKA